MSESGVTQSLGDPEGELDELVDALQADDSDYVDGEYVDQPNGDLRPTDESQLTDEDRAAIQDAAQ